MEQSRTKFMLWLLVIFLVVATGGLYFLNKNGYWPMQKSTSSTTTESVTPVEKDSIVIGMVFPFNNAYPECIFGGCEISFNTALFDQLVTFDRDNKVAPAIATKWDNPDDLTWRFYLNPTATFSNGDSLTAADIKFTYDYLANNKDLQLGLGAAISSVDSVNIIDDHTVEFKTKTPDPILLNRLASIFMVLSKKDVEANGLKTHLGSGPYTITSQSDSAIVLARNENYWGKKPKIKTITYKAITGTDKISSLLNGTVDFITYAYSKDEAAKITSLEQNSNFETAKALSNVLLFMDWDTTRDKSPYINAPRNPLKDIKVRQAIYMGINIDEILKSNQGSVALTQIAYPGLFGYNPNIKRPTYNLVQAKALLKEAGYENGFSMTIDYIAGSQSKELFQPVADELAKLNIKATMNGISDQNAFYGKIMQKDTSAYIIGNVFPTQDASEILEGVVHTPTQTLGLYNLTYSNPSLDTKIEEIGKTLNQQTRQQKMQEALKLAMDDVTKIPLFQGLSYYSYNKDIYIKSRLDGTYRIQEFAGKSTSK